ncbi:speckle-type POZ protein-like [Planococcus citri]|uniref:speckle-type POZ protein-like n=1 Tax=Planococcus citri TaxID=170843 RepID=UPI0031F93E44
MSEKTMCLPVTDNVCLTKVNPRKTTYLWAVENFSSIHDSRREVLKSSPFAADDDYEFKWCLHLDPYHEVINDGYGTDSSQDSDDSSCRYRKQTVYVLLQAHPADECSDFMKHSPVTGTLKFAILNAVNKQSYSQNMKFSMAMKSCTKACSYTPAGFSKFIKRSDLLKDSDLLSQDKLTIYCEISYVKKTDVVNISGKQYSNLLEEQEPAALDDIGRLFMNEDFSDVRLSVENKIYPAHKIVLIARSPVFGAMFSYDTKEKQSNCIELQDITFAAFREMLRYMYTGKVQNLKELAPELLAAADKYDLKNLKIICEKELYETLSQSTAVATVMLADMYHAENLKKQALLYMRMYSYTLNMMSEKNRNALKSFPNLLLEIIDMFGEKNVS